MWLLAVEIVAAIIASLRGWGAKPWLLVGGTVGVGLILGAMVGPDAMLFLQVVDYIVVAILVIMAIAGKRSSQPVQGPENRVRPLENKIQCPQCAEWIMAQAKVCRFCGCRIQVSSEAVEVHSDMQETRQDQM